MQPTEYHQKIVNYFRDSENSYKYSRGLNGHTHWILGYKNENIFPLFVADERSDDGSHRYKIRRK